MTSKTVDPNISQVPSPRLWFGLIFIHLFIPLILIICGGDFIWWQAWVYSVLLFASGIGGRFLAEKRHPGILVERVTSEKTLNAKPWDKVLSPLMAISLTFPLVIVAGLDHRYEWTPMFSTWLNIIGLGLIALGYTFAAWSLVENRFFTSTVRVIVVLIGLFGILVMLEICWHFRVWSWPLARCGYSFLPWWR